MNTIYYLSRSPEGYSLLLPSELPENYYSPGSFYIISDVLEKSYSFPAYFNEQLVFPEITRFNNDSNFFVANIPEVGTFLFFAEKMQNEILYQGKLKKINKKKVSYRLRSWNHFRLDFSSLFYNFTFVGYIDTQQE